MTQFTIHRLGYQGDGITDGPLFAPLTLPGEVITGTPDGQTISDIRIEKPSPDRVSPPCRHFKSCGGCQLQHASDAFVADWKQDVVRAALAAHGLEAEFLPLATSSEQSRRRATFSARRTKKGALSGFHARASDVIIEIPDCRLVHPDLIRTLPVANALAVLGASRKHGLSILVTLSRAGLDVGVQGGRALDGPLRVELAGISEKHDLARIAWEDEVIVTRRPPEQIFGKVRVVPPPGAFLQATAEGEAALRGDVMQIVQGRRRVVELFAGCGTFSLPLAAIAEVHAVEGSRAMLEALDTGWRNAPGLKAVSHEMRDLFRQPLLPDELGRFDAAVIDPPRAGAEAQIAELCNAKMPVIAYVSCHPVSFARDAKALVAAGYRLGQLRVVDQFRWSPHVELVAAFEYASK